jgi:hypothetical protein
MNKLEEITDKVKEYKYLRDKGKVLDQPRFSKLLNSFPTDIEYLLQRLEIAQKSMESANEILSQISSKDLKNGTLRYEAVTIMQGALQQLKE